MYVLSPTRGLFVLSAVLLVSAKPTKQHDPTNRLRQEPTATETAGTQLSTSVQPLASTTGPTTISSSSSCTPFVTPSNPPECVSKYGQLKCYDTLYCEYPASWGVGYDPITDCWTCT